MQAPSSMRRLEPLLGVLICLCVSVCVACGNGGDATGAAGSSATPAGAAGSTAAGAAGTTAPSGAAGDVGAPGSAGAAAGAPAQSGTAGTLGGAGIGGVTGAGGSATAGTTGAGGTGTGGSGAGGTTGAGGGAGMSNAVRSAGCGKPAGQALATFVKYNETITASALVTAKWQPRDYWVWLPSNYDPTQAYPTVFVGPGCGGTGNSSIPIQNASGNDAIVIGLDYNAAATGRDCFMTESFPDPEVNYVEDTVANVGDAFCVDKSRVFIEGFSSGSWIAYLMGCVDGGPGGLFKGQGNATGNWQGSLPDSACKGPIAYMAGHNNPDPQSYNGYPGGRDHVLKLNGCTTPPVTTPYDPGPMVKPPSANVTISCVQYMGCKAPTVFCTTTNLGHNDQVGTGLSTYGFWRFWMSLP